MRLNLKQKVTFLVSLLAVAGMLVLAARLAAVLQHDLETMIAAQLRSSVGYLADDLDHKLQLRLGVLSNTAAMITPADLAGPGSMEHFLAERSGLRHLFRTGTVFMDRHGRVIADYPRLKGRSHALYADRDFFKRVMATGKAVIGRPVMGRYTKQRIVPLAVPVRDASGRIAGVLGGVFRASDPAVFGELAKAKLDHSGFIRILSSDSRFVIWTNGNSRIRYSVVPKPTSALAARWPRQASGGLGEVVDSRGVESLALSRTIKSTGWLMIAGVDTKNAFAPIRKIKQEVYIATAVISLLIVAVLYLVLRDQFAPLVNATDEMRKMYEGTMTLAPIPVKRKDEIGELVGSFNRLVVERKQTEKKIRDLNRHLEQHVEERTAQLIAANKDLAREIEERKAAESAVTHYSERLQEMTRRYLGAQESERAKLARELHDRVSSNLTAIGLNLGLIEGQLGDDGVNGAEDRFADTKALLKDTMASAREISWDLHPASLTYGGVVAALDDYGRQYKARTGIEVRVGGSAGNLRLDPEQEIALFRIAQEALVNCAKHAHAHGVSVEFDHSPENLSLVIADDGDGFDPEALATKSSQGLGVLSMQERAKAIGATFKIESSPGQGTRVVVRLPGAFEIQ